MHTVIFYAGGRETGRWKRTLVQGDRAACLREAEALERAGYPALVHSVRDIEVIGLPEGPPEWWDFANLQRLAGKLGEGARRRAWGAA